MFSSSYFLSFYFLAIFDIIYKAPAAKLVVFCKSQLSFFKVLYLFLLLIVPEKLKT